MTSNPNHPIPTDSNPSNPDLSSTFKPTAHQLLTRVFLEKEKNKGKYEPIPEQLRILRDCLLNPIDQRFAICQTLISLGQRQNRILEHIPMNEQIQLNNTIAREAPKYSGLPICETDPSDESFLICTKNVPEGLIPERIYRTEKLEYFRTITVRSLVYQWTDNLVKNAITKHLLSKNDSRYGKLFLGKIQLVPSIKITIRGDIQNAGETLVAAPWMVKFSLEKDEDLPGNGFLYTVSTPEI